MQISLHIYRPQHRNPIFARRIMPMKRYLSWIFILAVAYMTLSSPLLAQTYDTEEDIDLESKEYHESALRRFEIVFTASIPFAALHSYLAVRTVEMIRQEKVAPSMGKANWNSVGGLTILFSGFIAFWDYMHTRETDIQDLNMERSDTIPLTLLLPASSIGYTHRIAPREPMLRLLSVRF